MTVALNSTFLTLLSLLVGGSLLSLSDNPHWFIRVWDFPRVQIIVLAWVLTFATFLTGWMSDSISHSPLWAAITMAISLTCWHGFRIFPYTPIAKKQAKSTATHQKSHHRKDPSTLRVVISNVKMENDQHDLWMKTIRDADPDLLIVLEADKKWVEAVASLSAEFSEQVIIPQENWYGMMMLSKLPMVDPQVRYLVQDDVPSIDAHVRMQDGHRMRVIAVHPRPPEPIRGTNATARDAELTLWGLKLADEPGPTIIGGDLNDVAWSATTRLFLRISEMLDPRRGRGMFNTFHAKRFWMRYPLDHVFVSPHFTISALHLLPFVGSDHFPIQIDLCHAPERKVEHEVMTKEDGDEEEAKEKVERAIGDPNMDGETVSDGSAL